MQNRAAMCAWFCFAVEPYPFSFHKTKGGNPVDALYPDSDKVIGLEEGEECQIDDKAEDWSGWGYDSLALCSEIVWCIITKFVRLYVSGISGGGCPSLKKCN